MNSNTKGFYRMTLIDRFPSPKITGIREITASHLPYFLNEFREKSDFILEYRKISVDDWNKKFVKHPDYNYRVDSKNDKNQIKWEKQQKTQN